MEFNMNSDPQKLFDFVVSSPYDYRAKHVRAVSLVELGASAFPVYDQILAFIERDHPDEWWHWEQLMNVLKNVDMARGREVPPRTRIVLSHAFLQLLKVHHKKKDLTWGIAQLGQYALPAVLDCLPNNREFFTGVLSTMGKDARAALPVLLELARSASPARRTALFSLGKLEIYTEEIETALREGLELERRRDRRDDGEIVAAILVVGHIGIQAAGLAPQLMKILDDDYFQYRTCAAKALGALGAAGRVAIPVLERYSKANDPELCQACTAALQQLNTSLEQ